MPEETILSVELAESLGLHFSINQETLEKVSEFQRVHPDISLDFFNKELNTTIVEMLFRMEREARGE